MQESSGNVAIYEVPGNDSDLFYGKGDKVTIIEEVSGWERKGVIQ